MDPRAERERPGAGRLDVARRAGAEVFELLDDPEPARGCLDAADRLVARLLVVPPRAGLAADGQGLDALDDRVVGVDVPVETPHLAVGDDVDPRGLHVADGRVRGVVEHLLQVRGSEVAVLDRFHRGEPPAGLAVRADDGGRDQRQRRVSGHRESLQSFPGRGPIVGLL